ncbi:MAG: hypothetical protein GY769_04780 [bacterium]|nr:hypothetical protein [bacterium]
MLHVLFFCLGFCIAIIYIDLVFDVSVLLHRTRDTLPASALAPITTYYRHVTKNPWLLIFVMTAALTCIVAEVVFGLTSARVGYASLVIFAAIAVLAVARVIPGAQRLASGREGVKEQTRLARGLLVYHLVFLVLVLSLALLQSP